MGCKSCPSRKGVYYLVKTFFIVVLRMTFFFSFLCPSTGDQAEHYPGQSSSDDTQSGTQGPFFTSDASFLSDYQEEGE